VWGAVAVRGGASMLFSRKSIMAMNQCVLFCRAGSRAARQPWRALGHGGLKDDATLEGEVGGGGVRVKYR
jgi:hypothetical protein